MRRSRPVAPARRTRPVAHAEVDLVILELIRLTTRPDWTAPQAAAALLAKRHTRVALRLALAGVLDAQLDRDSTIANRSAHTLRAALGAADLPGSPLSAAVA